LKVFVSKSILYAYQNARWNQIKIAPKIVQNVPPKKHFLAQSSHPIVWFHPIVANDNLVTCNCKFVGYKYNFF